MVISVNPEADYAYVSIENEMWIVGYDRLNGLMNELEIQNFTVQKSLKA